MALVLIFEFLKKYWKLIAISLVSLVLILSFSFLYFQNTSLKGDLSRIEAQQIIANEQVKTQNEYLQKISITLKSNIAEEFLKNQERHDEQIRNLKDSISKSNAQSNRLYEGLNSKVSSFTDSTSQETLLRYVNVLNRSYQETNTAYGESGESLERAKIELNKCNSDISGIYSAVDTYNANLNKN